MDFYDYSDKVTAKTFAFNASEAQKNRDFQERMSSSAHAREVADLKNAGLNPVLSANASGASTPSGSSASGSADSSASSADAMIKAAKISAEATRYSADQSYNSAVVAADASKYGTDNGTIPGSIGSFIRGVANGLNPFKINPDGSQSSQLNNKNNPIAKALAHQYKVTRSLIHSNEYRRNDKNGHTVNSYDDLSASQRKHIKSALKRESGQSQMNDKRAKQLFDLLLYYDG